MGVVKLLIGSVAIVAIGLGLLLVERPVSSSDREHIEQLHLYGDYALVALFDGNEEDYEYYSSQARSLSVKELIGFSTAPILSSFSRGRTFCHWYAVDAYTSDLDSLLAMRKIMFPSSDWPFSGDFAENHLRRIENGFYDVDRRLKGSLGEAYHHCDELFPGYIGRMRTFEVFVNSYLDVWISRFESHAQRKFVRAEEDQG